MPRPVSPASGAADTGRRRSRNSTAETGTEDVLLFGDIVEALVQTAAPADGTPCANAAELAERLTEARLAGDRIVPGPGRHPVFDAEGQRQSGTGEHVVCLQADVDELDRLLPRDHRGMGMAAARLEPRRTRPTLAARGEPLTVRYNDHRPSRARGAAE